MSHIDWSGHLHLGIPALDAEHRRLAEQLNLFLSESQAGKDNQTLSRLLYELIELTKRHFINEEILLDRADYPDLPRHKIDHSNLLEAVRHFRERYREGDVAPSVTAETAEYLQRWLVEHIVNEDRRFVPFVQKLI